MRSAALAAALLLAACSDQPALPADPSRNLDPATFFAGRSHGQGVLHTLTGGRSRIVVDSSGRPDGNGNLILVQRIREGDKPPRVRRWVMRPAGPNRYSGSLTDAAGPVEIAVEGPRGTIRYTMKNGMAVEQTLALQPGGRRLLNRLTVHRFGIRLATLGETIRKLD